ncbi:MAG: hypothetical protein E6J45_03100, partial [Chloroflexi bacterium]
CRHARIADYFGEEGVARICSACDNCLHPAAVRTEVVDPIRVAEVLACVARFDGHLGAARIAAILHGSVDAWTSSKPWISELAFFGALRDWDQQNTRSLIDRLIELGWVTRGHGEKPTLRLTVDGRAILNAAAAPEVSVDLEMQSERPARRRSTKTNGSPTDALSVDAAARFDALRRWRLDVARREAVPPYVVFHDRTLVEIARVQVLSLSRLAAVPGVGPVKLQRYGESLLASLTPSASG